MNTPTNYLPDDVLTSGEVAKLCLVNFRTVIRWAEKGLLPAYRLPGRGDYRIRVRDLTQFMHSNNMPVPASLQAPTRKVLVVDDELAMVAAIERCLRREGYTVMTATSGIEAGVLLATFSPDVVTLDLRMPGLDGFKVLDLIASSTVTQKPRIMVISAETEEKLKQALERGAHACLAKPFTNEELLQRIRQLWPF
jgi:excisionase family DNA binding protein